MPPINMGLFFIVTKMLRLIEEIKFQTVFVLKWGLKMMFIGLPDCDNSCRTNVFVVKGLKFVKWAKNSQKCLLSFLIKKGSFFTNF